MNYFVTDKKPTSVAPSSRTSVAVLHDKTVRLEYTWQANWKMVWRYNGKVFQMNGNKRDKGSTILRINNIVQKADNSSSYGIANVHLNLNIVGMNITRHISYCLRSVYGINIIVYSNLLFGDDSVSNGTSLPCNQLLAVQVCYLVPRLSLYIAGDGTN